MRVFICYSWRDIRAKNCLYLRLAGRFDLWVDSWSLRLGGLLDSEIEGALQSSGALILLWSKNAKASRWVRNELAYFLNLSDLFAQHRIVIPVCLDNASLPVRCAQLLRVELRDRMFSKENWDAIEEHLMSSAILI